jgi:aspartyl-tRNA(Asn)/glutamyl-tRNA(Gln) amidotransferase subunit A
MSAEGPGAAETAAEIAAAVRAGTVTAAEIVERAFARLQRLEPKLHAFLHPMDEEARRAAAALDQRREKGERESLGPLAGVPVALKDNLSTRGIPTTCASRILEGFRPAYDATAVERLVAAGAVILGKANMDEFAMGSSGENSAFGPTRNPWDVERVPGGSSSGSAAAVAAEIAPIALGSDTGGSVRQPGALCGVFALKPTYGRVSRYGLIAFASSLDQIGPFARTSEDLLLALHAIAGHDPRDSTSHPGAHRFAGPKLSDPPTLGVPHALLEDGLDADTGAIAEQAIERFRGLGMRIADVTLPRPEHALAAYYLAANAEASANLARYDGVRYGRRVAEGSAGNGGQGTDELMSLYEATRSAGFGPEVKRRIMLGTYALSAGYYDAYYLRAQKARSVIRTELLAQLAGVDAILLPTSPTVAFRLGERTADPLAMYLSDLFTIPVNLAGLPALSFPAGRGPETGLPVGMQLIGRPFAEESLIELSRRFGAAAERPDLG